MVDQKQILTKYINENWKEIQKEKYSVSEILENAGVTKEFTYECRNAYIDHCMEIYDNEKAGGEAIRLLGDLGVHFF